MSRLRTQAMTIFLVALAVRLLHVWQMRDTVYFLALMGDSRGYYAWAQRLAAGDWIGTEVFYQAPLYPYFLGVLAAVFGEDLLMVRLVQALLGAFSCVALGYAGARMVSRRAGLLAGLMLALYPPAIFFDGLVQKSVLDVLLICISLAIIGTLIDRSTGGTADAAGTREHRGLWFLLGAAMGALSLTRENALILMAVAALWALTKRSPGRKRSLAPLGLFAAGLAIVLSPPVARNYAVGGGVYLTTSQFGSNLYIGNNPSADGSYMSLREGRGSPEFERLDATELAEEASDRTLTPREVSRYWTNRTLAYVRSDPGDWLALLARKMRLLVSSTEVIDTESQESHAEYSWPLRVLGGGWHFGVLLPLGAFGAMVLWPRRERLWPLYAMTAAYAASMILFYVVARYRLPLVPLVIVFAAAGVSLLVDSLRGRAGTSAARLPFRAASVAVLVAAVANWPLYTAASQQAITENNLGTALQEDGRVGEAIERYKRALALDPDYTPAMNNLGTALRAAGRVDEAVATYERALALDSDRATLQINMGNALLAQGRLDEAIQSFRQAVTIDPRARHAVTSLANALYDSGTAALEAGAFDRASSALREAIQLNPDYAEAHNNLGIALASQGRLAEAVTHWKEAIRLDPGLVDARRNLELARRKP